MKNARCCRMLSMGMSFSWLVPDQKARRNLAMILTLLLAAAVQAATTWYVDANLGKDGGSDATRDDAKQSIQEAIDAAAEGDTIEVNDGTYEPFDVANKAITIRSVNGPEKTIIDGGNAKRCATLGDSPDFEDRKATLEGFTLQNGCAGEDEEKWPGQGSGAFGGMLTNCILTKNTSPSYDSTGLLMPAYGGGAFNCLLTNCTLTENQARIGGGANSSTLNNCKLIENTATEHGGGMANGLLTNCILVGNTALAGGGIYGGGLANCTVIGNTATETGGGAVLCGVIANSIVWGNIAPENANYSESNVDYSCTEPLPEGEEAGEGNISADPMFTDAENGDYTLKKGSPCIDSGSNEFVLEGNKTDLAGNPRIMGGTVDMGAYEASSEGVPSKTWYVDANQPDDAGDGRTWETAKKTIQAAINRAADDDTILVNDGFYASITTAGKAIVISSVNGAEKTIIDGNGVARCATLGDYGSERKTVLEGFTLQNGYADKGGGACGGTLRHCTLTNNGSPELMWHGQHFYFDCEQGGGAYDCTLSHCLVQNNNAKIGGGAYECVMDNCVLANNSAGGDADYESRGGGAWKSVLALCVLTGNRANYGGGACDSELLSCLLTGNRAEYGGGTCDSILVNCTVTENHADSGGGIAASYEGIRDSTAYNCIIWGNSAWTGANYDEDSNLSYSCAYPWASDGDGNISRHAPIFVDGVNGDFRLRTGSPGIDAGNSEIFEFFEDIGIFEEFLEVDTDLAGNPRIINTKVDMGAYEGAVDGCVISGRVQGNGILSPMTAVVAQGDSVTFTATATRGAFQHFEVDGVVVSDSPTYTWDNIQADGVITAVFAIVTWHVDAARPDDNGDGLSWDTAKKTIQAAIDRAAAGDLILVKPGVYAPIVTDDKAIVIRSVNGAATTVIDGGGSQRCATLSKSYYGRQTVLDGFTLRNGVATASGGGLFGGTALNCRITNCFAAGDDDSERTNGGGGASYATLRNCILSKNQAPLGGAAEHCSLDNCILTANQADHFGGGASSSILSNCTVTDNAAQRGGGGVYECTVYNSIVWNNQAPEDANYDTDESSYTPTALYYSCSDPKPQGAGNISAEPCFVDVSHGDFRLRFDSPCVDAGDNRFVQSATDLAGNPRIDNEKVDMGALEGSVEGRVISGRVQGNGMISPQTAVVAQGGSVTFTATATGGVFQHFLVDGVVVSDSPTYTWNDIQADGMITAVFTTATWYVDGTQPDDNGDGLNWDTAKKTIQAALDVANDGDEVLVKAGVYEPIDGYGREVTISSISGAENTIIDGGGARGCARAATLEGFTLQNGLAAYGGGAFDCILKQCILSGNTAELAGGGAISSTLNNCIVVGNEAVKWGGGGAASSTLNNCLLTGNTSTWGGGAFGCELRNCTVTGNSAGHSIAGVYSCVLQNCIVWDNFRGNTSDNYAYSQFLYSCSDPLPDGKGNISDAPEFVDAANGVYHLRLESPCINAGCNDFVREGDTDLAGGLRVRNETVDMGAYERDTDTLIVLGKVQGRGKISPQIAYVPIGDAATFTAEETSVRFLHFLIDGQTVSEEPTYTWNNIQADGVITAVFGPAVLYVDAARPDDSGDGLSWATAKKNLQSAVVTARDGETIQVKAGCYAPINTGKKSLVIRSVDGANATIIDGGGAQRCVTLGDDSMLLEGFTLQNGFAGDGGGVSGGRLNRCVISGNTAEGNGGGAYGCRLTNCVLSRNYARFYNGGGAYNCQLGNCTVVGNAAGEEGGGISRCVATNCIVWDNWAATMANYNDSQFRYSCMTPLPYGDEGDDNISANPRFVDAVNGDFRLRADSPCIDAGDSNYDSGDADFAGNPRREGPAIDMGAYEGAVAGYVISGRVQGDGALLPMTAVVPPGGASLFEAVETGSAFLHFLVDGEIVSEASNYTWANVQADGVITAVFATNTWYVDAARSDDNGDGRTWETAKKTIQAAVEIAGKDDLILVNPGIYEPVEANTHPLVIRSAQGFEATIIDAVGKTRCATLGNALREASAVLDGFTLRHGRMGEGGGAMGGALNNCLLTNNFAYHGGGAAYSVLNNCTLTGNTANEDAGGAYSCTLDNCTLTGNTSNEDAGGAYSCILNNCTLTDNTASENGGGSYNSILNNCLLVGNSAQYAAAAIDCTLTNCTVSKNTAAERYGGVHYCTLYNSIVWGNTAPKDENHADSIFAYSCTDPRPDGENNLSENPMFVNVANGDYRLKMASPCINAGNNSFAVGETDLAGNPRIRAGRVDMGALEIEGFIIIGRVQGAGEMHPQGDVIPIQQEDMAFGVFVAPGASVTFEAVETVRSFRHFLVDDAVVSGSLTYTWENIQADGVIVAVFEPKTWYVDDDQDGDGSSWENALPSIQAAIDAAADGDTILVNDGIYDSIWTGNRAFIIRSLNGANKTIIDGERQERCATLADDSLGRKTLLDGFTLQNGYAEYGGGGVYGGTLRNCVLALNSTKECGGGAAYSILINCILVFNSAREYGGGAAYSTLTNCTLTGNDATRGGGIAFDPHSNNQVVNCIVWGNRADEAGDNYYADAPDAPAASPFMHTCTDPLPEGEGNICEEPLFVDVEAGDFRLSAESPCIDAGSNALASGDVDLAGNPRILYGIVDMGAFEFTSMSALPGGKYDWQSGWNTLYLPFDSIDPDTVDALAKMPVFELSASTYVKDRPVPRHTPLWVFCADPESAPVFRGVLTSGMPPNPLDIPAGQWTTVGAQCRIKALPAEYTAWEWRERRYAYVRSLQPGRVYYIYRFKTP